MASGHPYFQPRLYMLPAAVPLQLVPLQPAVNNPSAGPLPFIFHRQANLSTSVPNNRIEAIAII